MSRFDLYRPVYAANWAKMQPRAKRLKEIDHEVGHIIAGKARYQTIEQRTAVPWWFVACCHYRESSFNFDTYLGNGQTLHRRTTIVPIGRGPFASFEDGAYDALRIEGFINCVDWSIERTAYRLEGFNGYGYHAHNVPSPYLYGGSTVYGPPEARGGKYVADHVFNGNVIDPQLGTLTLLKRLIEIDGAIPFTPPLKLAAEPDDVLADGVAWVQHRLNAAYFDPATRLATDGLLGKHTMRGIAAFQRDHALEPTGLPDSATVDALKAAPLAPHMLGAPATPALGEAAGELLQELYK